MPAMPVVASDAHRGHDPPYEVNFGQVVRPGYERVERAELLRAALVDAGHPVVEPAPHGLEPVLAVHEPALVEFLDGAYAAWRAAGGPEVLIPDTRSGQGLTSPPSNHSEPQVSSTILEPVQIGCGYMIGSSGQPPSLRQVPAARS